MMPLTPEEEALTQAVRNMLGPNFKFWPFAVYDEALDCVRVVLRDCSACECRVDERLDLLRDNYDSEEFVGFTINGIAHYCNGDRDKLTQLLRMFEMLNELLLRGSERAG